MESRGHASGSVVCADVAGSADQSFSRCHPRSPLARVALADGTVAGAQALADLLDREDTAARDALSATCTWLACGVSQSAVAAVSGGPFAGPWLGNDVASTGAAWLAGAGPPRTDRAARWYRRGHAAVCPCHA